MEPHRSLLTFPHSPVIRPARQRPDDEKFGSLNLSMEVSIRADARRLFHALTAPEYVELWLSIPGQHTDCWTVGAGNDQEFAIEHFCGGRRFVGISGRYAVCRRRNVMFTWRVEGGVCVPETQVDIRLRGDFERTTLRLRHTGFVSRHDFAWHHALWNLSIGRLAALYGSPEPLLSSVQSTRRRV
jgi:uncharacterized protein YndB with AHSA1/START domain